MNESIERIAAQQQAKLRHHLEMCHTLPDGYLRQLHARATSKMDHSSPLAVVQVDALALTSLVDAVRASRGLPPVVTALPTDAEREAQR